ncbi:Hypothetical Protein FCC1311_083832 [Hondaea fermentalgiana]|uniref:Cytochrome b561 domain-containing protein n=1 Tax=Hondaea fermentalgiana TaxID=2315210 RepID=A0A2R5GQX3_9STRA|nr:Hypothetical Protein FCC1311_083832 [Hondaea fermentalgiana]|eukprot:GBG32158.1 Hypothetical Protein FCC1311_083832 [Hondaea fermentalgiana]
MTATTAMPRELAEAAIEADPETMDIVRLVHGALMLESFALLVPLLISYGFRKVRSSYIGASSAVTSTSSLPMQQESLLVNPLESVFFFRHVVIAYVAFASQIAGIILIVLFKSEHLDSTHAKVGVAVMGVVVLQMVLGIFRPNKFTRPAWWIFLHRRLLPMLVFLGGLAAIALGMLEKSKLDGQSTESLSDFGSYEWLVVILASTIGLLYVVASFANNKLRKIPDF